MAFCIYPLLCPTVSFIIYLTDPDETWEEADGGSLEIYPLSEEGKLGSPAVAPIKVR